MIGPAAPVPVPEFVLDALTEITVTHDDTGSSGFMLNFKVSKDSPLQLLYLLGGGGSLVPFMRAMIIVTMNGKPNVIMDGMITNHQLQPGTDKNSALLSLTGEDLTTVMDRQEFSGLPFPAMPAEARVALLVAKYSFLGIIPMVIPSVLIDTPIPTSRIESQEGTDLAYIRKLADRVGYVFYIEPGPQPGMNIAYWGPKIKVGKPQPALNMDMDVIKNIENISFQFDNSLNTIPTVFYYDEVSKVPITVPVPPVTPLNPPLGMVPPIPTRLESVSDELSKYSLPKAIMIGLAMASNRTDAVSGSGSLDVLRYGNILKARQLVGVRGVGDPINSHSSFRGTD
ncbi:MAG: hypothetical protein P8X57_07855 [Cyclobacteriaceae bacterium]